MVALANAAGLRAGDAEPIDAGEYVFTLFLSAVWLWPVYMLALLLLGRRGRFRLWAFALCPVLVLGMSIAVASRGEPRAAGRPARLRAVRGGRHTPARRARPQVHPLSGRFRAQ